MTGYKGIVCEGRDAIGSTTTGGSSMGGGHRSKQKHSGNGKSGTDGSLVIKLCTGVCIDPRRGNAPGNIRVHPTGDGLRLNNHGGTVIAAGRQLQAYEAVDLKPGDRVSINGTNGRVVRE